METKNPKMRWFKWLAAILILAVVGVTGISVVVGWKLTHPDRKHVVLPTTAEANNITPVSFPSRTKGVELQGWLLPAADSHKMIVFAHGYRNNRLQSAVNTLSLAKILNEQGYSVLLFDFRDCGESGGEFTSLGQYEKEDLKGAVDFAKTLDGKAEHVGVIGFSMGAATVLITAAEDSRIEAVVADAPFADLREYLQKNMPVWTGLPSYPFTPVILSVIPKVLPINPETVSPIRVVKEIKAPILFIHGKADTKIPYENSQALFQAAPKGNQLWLVEGADHVKSFQTQPQAYAEHILALFAKLK